MTDPDDNPIAAVSNWRKPIAWALTVLAAAALAGAVYFINRSWDATPPARPAETAPGTPAPEPSPDELRRGEFVLAAFSLTMLAVALAAAGIPALVTVEKPSAEGTLRDTRRLLLTAGGLVGLVLMAGGLAFFVYHFGEITAWLRTLSPPPGAYKPLLALLAFVFGAGLAFAAVQTARAEERDDPLTRRLVYGVNVTLTSLLLLAALVVVNVIIGLKVPNKIDTTVTGVYSYELAPATVAFVDKMTTPVKITAILSPEGRPEAADARRLLDALRAANPAKITVEYLSPSINAERVAATVNRFPAFRALGDLGLIVAAGDDEAQSAVVAERDMLEATPAGGRAFVGESKLLREMLFLDEGKVKPVIYVATGHGELAILDDAQAAEAAAERRPAAGIRQALEKVYFELKPLRFDAAKPEVPADAQLVLLADPRTPLSPGEVAALSEFGKRPKPGKLLVLGGPSVGVGGKVADAGLNGLLGESGLGLSDRYIAAMPGQGLTMKDQIVLPARDGGAVAERLTEPVLFTNCREVTRGAPRDPQSRVVPILLTQPGSLSWLESDPAIDPAAAMRAFRSNPSLAKEKRLTQSPVVVAASAVSGESPRVVVFGSGDSFADRAGRGGANPNAQLLAVAANTLRERPAVADVAAKPYGVFTPNPDTDVVKTVMLPGLMAVLGTAALGLGVWMVRRR